MSGFWNVIKAGAKTKTGQKIISALTGGKSKKNPHLLKINLFFEHFKALPSWFTNLWILVCASIFGIKGTQIFRGGKK